MWRYVLLLLSATCAVINAKCPSSPQGTAKLVCYYEGRKAVDDVDVCGCTHLVYTGEKRDEDLAEMSAKLLEKRPKLKLLLRTNGKEKNLVELLKSSVIHGVDLHEVHSVLNRTKIVTSVESIRSSIGSDAVLMMTLPTQSELLAKYYDFKAISKSVSLFSVETDRLGEVENETFHPSRLSGVWDMMNTDSVVDLLIGLGVESAKIVIMSPTKAYKFYLQNNTLSTPGSPTKDLKPILLNQTDLCSELNNGEKWTLERDQDLSAPYAFREDKWLAFEDASSLDVKGKYARIRSLAGLGLIPIDDDAETKCGPSLLQVATKALGSQARAPRGAILGSLENEILSAPIANRLVDSIQLSPYRISRVVDSDGVIHAVREDTRTEFECQRQGYFVHPRSCNRFYRCVKFDQLSDEFTVFEFDCPAGLEFDSRWEVCVWPGSLSHGQACPGSSEIAPVPKSRFVCPGKSGYYADPGNCRWFFACMDHGKAPFSAYEFRCPFGLGFDESRLICDWPWLVPGCGDLGKYEATAYGHSSSIITGSSAHVGSSPSLIAGHQNLASGASASNVLGIHGGYETYQNGGREVQGSGVNVQNVGGYVSNSHILTDYNDRNHVKSNGFNSFYAENSDINYQKIPVYNSVANVENQDKTYIVTNNGGSGEHLNQYGYNNKDLNHYTSNNVKINNVNSGAYYHDNSGDYKHDQSGEYHHDASGEHQANYYRYGQSSQDLNLNGKAVVDLNSQYKGLLNSYNHENTGSYNNAFSSQYKYQGQNNNQYANQHASGLSLDVSSNHVNTDNFNNLYVNDYSGQLKSGADHVLSAGAINYGLIGDIASVDYTNYGNNYQYASSATLDKSKSQSNIISHNYDYSKQNNNFDASQNLKNTYSYELKQQPLNAVTVNYNAYDGAQSYASENTANLQKNINSFSAVSTDKNNYNVYVTPSPITYTSTLIPSPPKSNIKEIFSIHKPEVSYVQPLVSVTPGPEILTNQHFINPVKQPSVVITDYNKPIENIYPNYQSPTVATITQPTTTIGYQTQNYISSTTASPIINYEKASVTPYVNPLLYPKNVTPLPTISSVSTFIKQPTVSTIVQKQTTPIFVAPTNEYNTHHVVSDHLQIQNQKNNFVSVQPNNYYSSHSQQTVQPLGYEHVQNNIHNEFSSSNQNQFSHHTSKQEYSYQPVVSQQTSDTIDYYNQPVISSTISSVPKVFKGPEYLPPKIESPKVYIQNPTVQTYNSFNHVSSTASAISSSDTSANTNYHYQNPIIVSQQPPINPVVLSSTVSTPIVYTSSYPQNTEAYFVKPISSSTIHYDDVKKPTITTYVSQSQNNQHYNINNYQNSALLSQNVNYDQIRLVPSTPASVNFAKTFNYLPPKIEINHYQTPKIETPKIQLSTPSPFIYQKPQTFSESHYVSSELDNSFSGQKLYNNENNQYIGAYISSENYQPSYQSTISPPKQSTYASFPTTTYKPIQSSTYIPKQYVQSSSSQTPNKGYSYTTKSPAVTTTYKAPEYLPPAKTVAISYENPKYDVSYQSLNKVYSSTTAKPNYQPPISFNINPIQNYAQKSYTTTTPTVTYKQPILFQQNVETIPQYSNVYDENVYSSQYSTEKGTNLLGFSTVGPNAGLVSSTPYLTSQKSIVTPIVQKVIPVHKTVTPVYSQVTQKIVEVTPPVTQKLKQKITVVTKVNDYNPLIVRKLGAVCSCRSNVLHLRKPNQQNLDDNASIEYDVEYDYNVPVNGEDDEEWTYKSGAIKSSSISPINPVIPTISYPSKSTTPIVIKKPKITVFSSTFKPIIVPDESYDEEEIQYTSSIKPSLQPIIVSEEESYSIKKTVPTEINVRIITEEEKPIRGRPIHVRTKVRPITAAPTIATVLVPEKQSTIIAAQNIDEEQGFDRYGPGGWRGRDETLQGTINCQRVGLFRHPKHCNKFYSCRWDCTKKKFTLHVFNCPIQLSFDPSMGACNWPSQGPSCQSNTLLLSGH